MFPAGGDVLRWLLAVHVVPRAILAGVVTWYNCNNALHVGGWTQWLYAALVFGNLVADLCATVELSGIGQLLKPGEPHCLSCINFVGYSLVGMAVTCVVLHMRRQGRRCLHGLLLLAFVAAVVMHISLAVHTAHCLEIAQHIFRFCHYGFLLAKLGFDSFILHDMTNVLE